MSDYLSRNYPKHPALTAEAGFKRPMSHAERCACGSNQHVPGSCAYCRSAVAEHLARTSPRCTVSGCESELAEHPYRCLHCGQPTCWHHFARSSLADSCVHVACHVCGEHAPHCCESCGRPSCADHGRVHAESGGWFCGLRDDAVKRAQAGRYLATTWCSGGSRRKEESGL